MVELRTDKGDFLYFEGSGIVSWNQPGANDGQCIFDTRDEAEEVIDMYGLKNIEIHNC